MIQLGLIEADSCHLEQDSSPDQQDTLPVHLNPLPP